MSETAAPRRRRRVFLWVFLAVQALFVLWLVVGVSGGSRSGSCTGLDAASCQSARDAGTAIGAGLVIVLWALVDLILGVTYGIWRLARR